MYRIVFIFYVYHDGEDGADNDIGVLMMLLVLMMMLVLMVVSLFITPSSTQDQEKRAEVQGSL